MKLLQNLNHQINRWAKRKFLQISVFNLVIILLFLLRSAGYFDPYFLISVNLIVTVALILAIPLLGANSRTMFVASLVFWLFVGFLRVLNLDVWAERTAVYTYEALVIGVVLLIYEEIKNKNFHRG
ncbi:hypothetical protein A2975_02720 [Candidatus Woesebacteria bacterium RIFCSPLOWO2_01_FULL_44_14]|uniref:Uncharacterized protein n=1 Tax=Candidatus Woesebacteria bacterium RIFCSPLOWO2_01_FULL_44_14 TaxID=1802525 RepID=A0A1F8C4H9_9BACT|nr:MAG: hypothetical protein A2975_02720 [Candidatus Woesebacteria bacterium RIFCSPLOWO2_01_FULL_44_14]